MLVGTVAGSLAPLAGLPLLLAACTRTDEGSSADALAASSHESAASAEHDCSDYDGPHAHAPGDVKGVLDPSDRGALTTLRVTAHVGAVTLRKREGVWLTAGPRGCAVSASRVGRALDNLAAIQSTPTTETLPVGARFELQIDALADERHVVHLEIAGRRGDGELARLRDDTTVVIRGLDRSLWLPDPEVWCGAP